MPGTTPTSGLSPLKSVFLAAMPNDAVAPKLPMSWKKSSSVGVGVSEEETSTQAGQCTTIWGVVAAKRVVAKHAQNRKEKEDAMKRLTVAPNPVEHRRQHMLLPHRLPAKYFFAHLGHHQDGTLAATCLSAWKFFTFNTSYLRTLEKRIDGFDKYGDLEGLYIRTQKTLDTTQDYCSSLELAGEKERTLATALEFRLFRTKWALIFMERLFCALKTRSRGLEQGLAKWQGLFEWGIAHMADKMAKVGRFISCQHYTNILFVAIAY